MNRLKKKPAGVTLIELTIAIAIFSVVMIIAFDAFLNVLKFNRETVQKQSIQDHTEFLFSLMSKEIRMARINYRAGVDDCTNFFSGLNADVVTGLAAVPANSTYLAVNADNDGAGKHEELRFQNYENLCVRYFMAEDTTQATNRLKVTRYNPTTNKIDGIAPGAFRESWVLPINISVSDLDFSVKNMFDQRPTGPLQPPLVKYYIGMTSTIWNPSHVEFFNEIAGRNIEQF